MSRIYTFALAPFTPAMNDGSHVFVFGSNLAGRHGKGAALEARLHWGAIVGHGRGRQGNSYAIPTKGRFLATLPIADITNEAALFIEYAWQRVHLRFLVTPIGTGLAGYKHAQIAPLFHKVPANCTLPLEWKDLL